jgi:hypothetical protein
MKIGFTEKRSKPEISLSKYVIFRSESGSKPALSARFFRKIESDRPLSWRARIESVGRKIELF